jgi:hypothetical protein
VSELPSTLKVLLLPGDAAAGARDWMLPAPAVVEVVPGAAVEPAGLDAPDWLVGTRLWRGLALPVVRLGSVASDSGPGVSHPYLAICVGVSGNASLPFFAVESRVLPKLEQLTPELLSDDPGEHPFALCLLRVKERPVALADLESVEWKLLAAGFVAEAGH